MTFSYYKDIYKLLCKRHPNSKIYVISDHHFYHSNIIQYQRLEFRDVNEMNRHIIDEHNKVIKNEDVVIFLGDFSFKKTAIKDILSQMKGHKYLLLGNHDEENLIHSYGDLGFEGIFMNPVKIDNKYLSHYPLQKGECNEIYFEFLVREFNNSKGTNYHGHIHTKEIGDKPFINVCCEAQDYKPLLIGYTEKIEEEKTETLIINSKEFENILEFLKTKKNINPSLIISDYIYSIMLQAMTPYYDTFCVQGSFPLYKKYGYISNFSDLDISLMYNENISKNKNSAILKEIFHTVYTAVQTIDELHISLHKNISNMEIFKILYASRKGEVYKGCFDSNLIPLDVYRDTDFISYYGTSTLEQFINKEFIKEHSFPRYESKFLKINGDIANGILQLLFQQDHSERKILILKKLKYIYQKYGNQDMSNTKDLEDFMIRFFIRNLMFFHTTRRKREYASILEQPINFEYLDSLSNTFKSQLDEILRNPNSSFNNIYRNFKSIRFDELPEKSREFIRTIKLEK